MLYQEGAVTAMLDPAALIARHAASGRLPDGTLMFCGTLAAHGGVRPTGEFAFELEDPCSAARSRTPIGCARFRYWDDEEDLPEKCNADEQAASRIHPRGHELGLGHAAGLPCRHQAEDSRERSRRGPQDGKPHAAAALRPRHLHHRAVRARPLGRGLSSCRATSSSATTRRARAANRSRRRPMPAVRPASITDRSSRSAAALLYEIHYYDESKK